MIEDKKKFEDFSMALFTYVQQSSYITTIDLTTINNTKKFAQQEFINQVKKQSVSKGIKI